jgi:hypothetical protein
MAMQQANSEWRIAHKKFPFATRYSPFAPSAAIADFGVLADVLDHT